MITDRKTHDINYGQPVEIILDFQGILQYFKYINGSAYNSLIMEPHSNIVNNRRKHIDLAAARQVPM
jgi:hypothetical protein